MEIKVFIDSRIAGRQQVFEVNKNALKEEINSAIDQKIVFVQSKPVHSPDTPTNEVKEVVKKEYRKKRMRRRR